jgi:hypothetical protein
MERTHDKRSGLKVGRVLTWGAYPPAAIVAASMEIGAQSVSHFRVQQNP